MLGQISLPVVNRTGLYSHWSSSGDNIHNFSRFFRLTYSLHKLLPIFFERCASAEGGLFAMSLPDRLDDFTKISCEPTISDYLDFMLLDHEDTGCFDELAPVVRK